MLVRNDRACVWGYCGLTRCCLSSLPQCLGHTNLQPIRANMPERRLSRSSEKRVTYFSGTWGSLTEVVPTRLPLAPRRAWASTVDLVSLSRARSQSRSRSECVCDFLSGPRWFNIWIMGGHQPLQPQVYERMPPQVRELMPGVTGKSRDDVYESCSGQYESTSVCVCVCVCVVYTNIGTEQVHEGTVAQVRGEYG